MIEFHLDPHSGVSTYLQLVQQVKDALRLGIIDVGDQLPTVREVVAELAIKHHARLRRELLRWLEAAERAGLEEESIRALMSSTLREAFVRQVA